MEFEKLRDTLIREHRVFDAETLKDLSYVDLVRAGIGDAGAAGCPLDMVRAERSRRVMEAADQIQQMRSSPSGPRLIVDQELYDAALRCLSPRPEPVPAFDSLSSITKAFLLIRCLRSHMDAPEPRLVMLHDVLQDLQDGQDDYRIRAYALLVGKVIDAEREDLATQKLDILRFRKDTFEFYKYLRANVPEAELPVRSHLEVTGYHCTYGCFLPGASA